MASGTVGYSDTRGNKDYLGIVANQIGKRIKQASNMAAEERAYAAKKAEEGGTSLEEAGVGKGYFFKRALGSRFGGDKIARTRGRLGAQGPGTDPSKNYKQRFRGGFDYNYSEQINQVTKEVGGAIVPMSSALSVGLRGVEGGLIQVSQSIATIGEAMGQLAVAQQDLARQAMMNGAFMRAFMTYMQRQQSRAGARREERSIEAGRRMLGGSSGGRRGISNMPGLGGGGGRVSFAGGGNIVDVINTLAGQSGNIARTAGRAGGSGSARLVETALSSGSVQRTVPKGLKAGFNFMGTGGQILSKKFVGGPAAAEDLVKHSKIVPFKKAPVKPPRSEGIIQHFDDVKNILPPGMRSPDQYYVKMLQDSSEAYFAKPGATHAGFAREIAKVKDPRLNNLVNSYLPELGSEVANLAKATGNTAEEVATNPLAIGALEASAKKGGMIGRILGKGALRSAIKKIPVIAGVAGVLFGIQRAMEGDFFGAALEITSGIMGATGVGAGASLGIDAYLLARDFGAPVPFAEGGVLTGKRPVNALMGEAGPEIITPLNDETFIKFGEGVLDAQKRNKSAFVALHTQPVENAIDKTIAKKSWWDNVKEFFGGGDDDKKSTSNPEALKALLGTTNGTTGTTPATPLTRVGRGQYGFGYNLPPTNTMSGQDYGDGRDDNNDGQIDRRHAGQDFDISGADEVFASQIGGVVTHIGNDPGGYGKYVDIVNKEKGVTERIAEGAEILPGIEIGATVTPGQPVVKGETNTGVIHYEIREGGNVDPSKYKPTFGFEGTKDPMTYLKDNATLEGKVSGLTPTSEEMDWYKRTMQQSKETSQLNQDSSKVATAFSMPQIINNNTYVSQAAPIATSDDGNIGLAFQTLGLDAFSLEYSLANKA